MTDAQIGQSSGYADILTRISDRAADAVIGKGRVRSDALRAAIARRLYGGAGSSDAFVADPVFEAARLWKRSDRCLDDLSGELLEAELVDVLDKAEPHRWPRRGEETEPYIHQMRAWQTASEGRSFMVTSGTGSGKTECFMIPMLNDLLGRTQGRRQRGVQAIILYPLNALIDSQKERLRAWTDPLASRLSYALYNRHLPESLPADKRIKGAEVPDRKALRADPASILVTNVTMLEYMLLRAQDRPILEQSQGTLRWIVLDEAHSYVGAQAAEMALLLRRVRDAFGVAPEDVRLAATSATIGEGERTRETLAEFLADLAGLAPDQVTIIEGEEVEPALPTLGSDSPLDPAAATADADGGWARLSTNPRIREVRSRMRSGGVALGEARDILGLDAGDADASTQTLRALEAAANSRDPETGLRLAPWRVHVFHRAQGGLWACVDPECRSRSPELRVDDTDWSYGEVYLEARETCRCGAPVFEIGACDECGTAWLLADIHRVGPNEYLRPATAEALEDDYILDVEPDDAPEEEGNLTRAVRQRVLVGRPSGAAREFLRLEDATVFEHPEPGAKVVPVRLVEEAERGCCARAGQRRVIARPQRFGAPFLMGNAMPLLLEAAAPNPGATPVPFNGRRLLSFTDSRQGTARFSAKLQQEAERTLTRAFVYHTVHDSQGDPDKAAALRAEVDALRPLVQNNPALLSVLQKQEAELRDAEGQRGPIAWRDMVEGLAANPELQNFARPVWRDRPAKGDNALAEHPTALAELFIYREFFRRPRLQNNAETMGIARLLIPTLEEQARLKLPEPLREAGHEHGVWSDLLHAALDIVFRATLAIQLPQEPADLRHWISPRSALSVVLEPGLPPDASTTVRNPVTFPVAQSRSNLVQLIYRLTGGARESSADVERTQTVLAAIWEALRQARVLWNAGPGAYRLDISKASIARLDLAFECPVTRRLLPFAPAGLSLNALDEPGVVRRVAMPSPPIAAPNGPDGAQRQRLRDWLDTDSQVANLRIQGHWTDLHDRVAEFSPFLRAQEHSAQIDRKSLQHYEEDFRKGEINVLNCSTTMEMGVDIPDVGLVVNTNVPPSPANYRQRIGRAGRRGEPWAMAFTFCKDLPLDRMIFRDPRLLLKAAVRAPQVRLDSAVIVQRHVNALLLGHFLRGGGGLNVRTGIGTFFGATPDPDMPFETDCVADDFLLALKGDWSKAPDVRRALTGLVHGTCLEGHHGLVARCENIFDGLRARWRSEYEQLLAAQAAYPEKEAAHRLYRHRAKRMCDEFMMAELARRGFTPAYGFPVDVVSFDHAGRDGAESGPSRALDMAIREYSPGCEVVIDGLVHRSDGILPTWGNRHDPSSVEDLRTLYTCQTCGTFGTTRRDVTICPRCDAAVQRDELLRPSGFLGTRKPHSAYEQLNYVPPDPPRVSAESGDWVALIDPELGRHRTAREGRVLNTSSGAHGMGYAICIACGRAEAETRSEGGELPGGLKDHYPLQQLRDNPRHDGRCPGNDDASRKVRRRVRLGTEATTDVFELQLAVLSWTDTGKAQARAIGAGLREGLAGRLGIDAETMGITVAPGLRADGRRASVFLHDKASGGSGFASAADQDLPGLLKEAAARLECPADCTHGCPECVLRRDLQFGLGGCDRQGALALLRNEVLPRLALPEALRLFGDSSRAITRPLAMWCVRAAALRRLDRLTLFLTDMPSDWDISDWGASRALREAVTAGAQTSVVIRRADVERLEMSQKLDLVRLVAQSGAELRATDAFPEVAGRPVLAEVAEAGEDLAVAATAAGAQHIDSDWGSVSEGPLVRGPKVATQLSARLSLDKLAAFGEGNTAHRDITTELDGSVARFGAALWKIVRGLRPQAFTGTRRLVSVTCNDRYLRSPLTARLLCEAWEKLPLRDAQTNLEIVSEAAGGTGRPGYHLHHNWDSDAQRKEVLEALLPEASVRLVAKSDCAHARFLRLHFEDGATVTVFLDQGFGAWREVSGRALRFDQSKPAAEQADALRKLKFEVALRDGGGIPSPIWVRW